MHLRARGLIALTLLAPTAAAADGLSVAWVEPSPCPAPLDLEANILEIARLRTGATLSARVAVAAVGPRRLATVTSSVGVRNVESSSCKELEEAVIVVVALMLATAQQAQATKDEQAILPPSAPNIALKNVTQNAAATKETAARTKNVPPSETVRLTEVATNTKANLQPEVTKTKAEVLTDAETTVISDAGFSIRLAAGLRGSVGVLPRAALAPSLRLAYVRETVALQANFAYAPQVSHQGPDPAQGRFFAWSTGLEFDWYFLGQARGSGPALGVGGGLEWGQVDARVEGISSPGAARGFTAAVVLGLEGKISVVYPLEAWARVDAAVPVLRPQFDVEALGSVYQMPPISGRLEIGLSYAFF